MEMLSDHIISPALEDMINALDIAISMVGLLETLGVRFMRGRYRLLVPGSDTPPRAFVVK